MGKATVSALKRAADYRLHIPYEQFRRSNAQEREKLLAQNALAAISDLDRKGKAARLDFDGARLAGDIKRLFKLTERPNSTPHRTRARAPQQLNRRAARAGERGR